MRIGRVRCAESWRGEPSNESRCMRSQPHLRVQLRYGYTGRLERQWNALPAAPAARYRGEMQPQHELREATRDEDGCQGDHCLA
jgi:hypothetical protein